MLVGPGLNEFGTRISQHLCDTCGKPFTLCPPCDDDEGGGNCLMEACDSYDITRDIDRVWDGVQKFVHREATEEGGE